MGSPARIAWRPRCATCSSMTAASRTRKLWPKDCRRSGSRSERGTAAARHLYDAVDDADLQVPGDAAIAAGRALRLELDNHDPRRKRAAHRLRGGQARRRPTRRQPRGRARPGRMHREADAPQPRSGASIHGPGLWDGLVVLCAANNWDEVKLRTATCAEHLSATRSGALRRSARSLT